MSALPSSTRSCCPESRSGVRWRIRVIALTLVSMLIAVVVALLLHRSRPHAATAPVFGVLLADPSNLSADYRAGIRLAMLSVSWASWEPRAGVIDQPYRAKMISAVSKYRAARMKVAVDTGLQDPPQWVLAQPGAQLVTQDGQRSVVVNFEFNEKVRAEAALYLSNVVASLGSVQYYRAGLSEHGEMLYPEAPANQWWAFDGQAQGIQSGLPPGVNPSPLPGWVPGTPIWRGQPVNAAQVHAWYDWYFSALVNAEAWEISTYRNSGFAGLIQLVMPGYGALPGLYDERLAATLADLQDDSYHTLNTGAVWWRMLDELPSLHATVVDVSSVGDDSGSPATYRCEPSDASVDRPPDEVILNWSDTRWLSYLARRHGLPVMGENPGNTPAGDLATIGQLVGTCGLTTLQWAWDYQLEGGKYVTRFQLHALIVAPRPRV